MFMAHTGPLVHQAVLHPFFFGGTSLFDYQKKSYVFGRPQYPALILDGRLLERRHSICGFSTTQPVRKDGTFTVRSSVRENRLDSNSIRCGPRYSTGTRATACSISPRPSELLLPSALETTGTVSTGPQARP